MAPSSARSAGTVIPGGGRRARSCSLRPATRISKNSSRLLLTMHRKRSRSSSGVAGSCASVEHAAVERELRQLAVDRRRARKFHRFGHAAAGRIGKRDSLSRPHDSHITTGSGRGIRRRASEATFSANLRLSNRNPVPPHAPTQSRPPSGRRRPRVEQLPARNRPRRGQPDLPARHVARDAAFRRRARRQGPPEALRDGCRARLPRAVPRAPLRPAPHGRARGRDQHVPGRDERAGIHRAGRAHAGISDRHHQRARGRPADLLRRGPRASAFAGAATGHRHRRRLDRVHHRPRTRGGAAGIARRSAASA